MATYFVWDGGNNTTGADWTNAKTTLTAGLALATTAGDVVKVAHIHTGDNALAVDTTYTTAASYVEVVCVDKDTDTPTPMDVSTWVGNGSANRSVAINTQSGAGRVYVYGINIKLTGGTDSVSFLTTGGHGEFEQCNFILGSGISNRYVLGSGTMSNSECFLSFTDCDFNFGATEQRLAISANAEMQNCTLSGSAISGIFVKMGDRANGTYLKLEGCDLSSADTASYIFDSSATVIGLKIDVVNCKLQNSFIGINPSVITKANGEVSIYNCASGDTHWFLGHADAMGSSQAISTIYPTTNTTDGISWQVTTTANASFGTPYVSPWFDVYHSGTSAITPEIEILRDGSATAFTTAEVWGDFSFQSNSGSPLSTIKSSRSVPLSAGSSLSNGIGSANWTNPPATNKSSKIVAPSATTPAEVGHLRARVCMGIPSTTLYADPTIRGI